MADVNSVSSSLPSPDASHSGAADEPQNITDGLRRRKRSVKWEALSPEEVSNLLPHYQVTTLLGKGGMAAVYRGRQMALERDVAIKVLPNQLADQRGFRQRFRLEAQILARFDHPGITRVYEFGETSRGDLYMVMEFVEGASLDLLVKRSVADEASVLSISIQICEALQYAHGEGVMHRDVKPANVMVTGDGRVKLADFGLARTLGDESDNLTRVNDAVGTRGFMAPEILNREIDRIDHRADLYSLGVLLYQMLTGKLPQGIELPLPGETCPAHIPFDPIVTRALQAKPERRYQQAAEMRADLEEIRSRLAMSGETSKVASLDTSFSTNATHRDSGSGRASGWKPLRSDRSSQTFQEDAFPRGNYRQSSGNSSAWIPYPTANVLGPGRVRSPHSGEEQTVPGYHWLPGYRLRCEKTGTPFLMPEILIYGLEAGLIPDCFDRVRTPYDRGGTTVKVFPDQWVAGGDLVCPVTGLEFRLPTDLPYPEAIPVVERAGWVRLPNLPGLPENELPVDPGDWEPGALVYSKSFAMPFWLPPQLPALRRSRFARPALLLVSLLILVGAYLFWQGERRSSARTQMVTFDQAGRIVVGGDPVPTPKRESIVGSEDTPIVKEVPPPSPWPGRVVLLQGVEPPDATVEATLVTSSGAESSGKVEVTKPGLRWIIDLSGILPSDARAITSLSLRFSAPGFESAPLPLVKRDEGWEEETFTRNELLSLNRLTSGVTLAGEQSHPCYGSVRFRMIEAPAGLRPAAEPYEFAIDPSKGRTHELHTGIYRVSLLARPGLSHSKGPVEVAERVLHERFEIGGKSGGTATVEIPAWPLPRSAVGVERTVLAPVKYAFFGRPKDADLGYVSGESTVGVERAIVLDLNEGPLEGWMYGEDSIVFDPTPFDTLACQYAKDIADILDKSQGSGRSKDGRKDFAPLLPYVDGFAAACSSVGATRPLSTGAEAWAQRRGRLDALGGLARRFEVHFIESSAAIVTSEFLASQDYKKYLEGLNLGISYSPLCQAVWLKTLLPASVPTPEYQGINREFSDYLVSNRGKDERAIGLPAASAREARFHAWERFVMAVFDRQVAPTRRDLSLLSEEFRAGGYEGGLLNVSAFRVSRVESDGSIKFEIDLKDDATRAIETKEDLTIDILDSGRFRLKLPRSSNSDLVLHPVQLGQ